MTPSKKVLSVFSLVMINVIAVDSLRTLPISAKLGLPLVSFYLLAALFFFVPVALVAAELATAYPNTGGLYIWVREAFGPRVGFITIWLQWIYNVVWYPTMLAFISATLAYLISPELANNRLYLLLTVPSIFWIVTLLNCFGMRLSGIVSMIGAVFGTLLPMLFMIFLGILWFFQHPTLISSWHEFVPDLSSQSHLAPFSIVLFGLIGVEMSAVHAEEVKNPDRDYPKAIFYSVLIIIGTLVLSSLSIVFVISPENLSVVSGLIDAFSIFFSNFGMPWMTPIIAICVILGSLSGIAAWIIGPTKGLLVAAKDGSLPKIFSKVTKKHGTPIKILMAQAIIVTLLSLVFILFDSINAAYWLLSDLCAELALIVYLFMFASAIKLRYSKPHIRGSYRIPGGKIGTWIVSGIGFSCCLLAIYIGFIPPAQVPIGNYFIFEGFLIGGLFLFLILPWYLVGKKRSMS